MSRYAASSPKPAAESGRQNGTTALHSAANQEYTEALDLLLQAKADTEVRMGDQVPFTAATLDSFSSAVGVLCFIAVIHPTTVFCPA